MRELYKGVHFEVVHVRTSYMDMKLSESSLAQPFRPVHSGLLSCQIRMIKVKNLWCVDGLRSQNGTGKCMAQEYRLIKQKK